MTDKEIKNFANNHYLKYHSGFVSEQIELDRSRNSKIESFVEGAKWMRDIKSPKDKALHWKAYGTVGASSETMFNYFMGNDVSWPDHPYDSGDFGRCYGLLEAVPEWKDRVVELASLSPEWKALVSDWQLLTMMHETKHDSLSDKIRLLIGA